MNVSSRFLLPIFFACSLSIASYGQQPDAPNWQQAEVRLTTAIRSGNSEQKRSALAEIRNFRSDQASRIAISALTDKDEMVRATAAAAVIFLPQVDLSKFLLPLLDDKVPFVRREAALALGQAGNSSAMGRLIALLEKDRDAELRSAAAVALGNIGDLSAIDPLTRVLTKRPVENDEFLRRSSAHAVGQILEFYFTGNTGSPTPQNFLPPEFKKLKSTKGFAGLRDLDIDTAARVLSQVLQSPKEADDTRREAAFALGAMRRPTSMTVLRGHLNSPDPYLAEICREAILKIESHLKIESQGTE